MMTMMMTKGKDKGSPIFDLPSVGSGADPGL